MRSFSEAPAHRQRLVFLLFLVLAFFILLVWAMTAGDYDISPLRAWQTAYAKMAGPGEHALKEAGISRMDEVIVWNIRLPRLFLAALAGVALAVSGAAIRPVSATRLLNPICWEFPPGRPLEHPWRSCFLLFFRKGKAARSALRCLPCCFPAPWPAATNRRLLWPLSFQE